MEKRNEKAGLNNGMKQRDRKTEWNNGALKKEKEIILKMYNKKMQIQEICEIVDLSREKVEEIIKEEKQSNV